MTRRSAVCCFALLAVTAPLTAQDTAATPAAEPDTPFRAGQWGAQFAGGSFFALGFLRFTSPRRAWLIDVSVAGVHNERTATFPTGTGDTTVTSVLSGSGINLRVGPRTYRGHERSIVGFVGFGLVAGFAHNAQSGFGVAGEDRWNAGVFGELGASYLVTRALSLGATAGATIVYGHSWARGGSSRSTGWEIRGSAPDLRIVAALYF